MRHQKRFGVDVQGRKVMVVCTVKEDRTEETFEWNRGMAAFIVQESPCQIVTKSNFEPDVRERDRIVELARNLGTELLLVSPRYVAKRRRQFEEERRVRNAAA